MRSFTKQFTNEKLFKEENVVEINKKLFLVNPKTKKLINKTTVFVDTYLGKFGGKRFIPSVFLLNEIKKNTEKKVIITKKGEWLFTCGRNLWRNNVISSTVNEGLALVLNENNECLGYGRVQQKKVMVEVLFDIGDFLRRER